MKTKREAAEVVHNFFLDPGRGSWMVRDVLHDDVVYECPFYDDFAPRVGKAELAAMFDRVETGEGSFFTDQSFPTTSLLGTEDAEVFIIEVTGDHGIRSTGKRYRNHYLHVLHLRDGEIVRWREFSNPNVFRAAATPD
jgi:ketosteroid isomerase-like protein